MTPEEKLELTHEQEKAFKSFKRAYKKCKKTGIVFYTVLETITALNGEHPVTIHDDSNKNDFCLQSIYKTNPYVFDWGFAGWADDDHFAKLK